jgi:hypothetical protein
MHEPFTPWNTRTQKPFEFSTPRRLSKAARVALEYWGAEKAFEFSSFPVDGAEFQLAFQIKLIAEYEAMHPPTSQHRTGRWAGRSRSGTEKLASSRPVTVFRCAGLFFFRPTHLSSFCLKEFET